MKYSAIIVAAGSGSRMNLGFNKVYAKLQDGRSILEHTMEPFLADEDCIQLIIVTTAVDYRENIRGFWPGKILIAHGGETRQQSVANGLDAVIADYVMIHDGARPYLTAENLGALKEALVENDGALLCVPCKDTIKLVQDGYVIKTYERDTLRAAQTPQAFRTEVMRQAMLAAEEEGYTGTDDCSLVEKYTDVRIKAAEGSYENYKITTPEDLK